MKNNLKKLLLSFKYAITGIVNTIKSERNMKIHICMMILVIIFGIILKLSVLEWIICIILFSLVIAGELFNTAIENVVDIIMPQKNIKAKIAKDAAAGAVLILSIGSAIIGLIIFVPKLLSIFC
ncbi:MAG: diacylglycerol kinase family protein [Clostridia bacterium]|nr:diacylglycerol kinase family protein [Clostridia bacterium]